MGITAAEPADYEQGKLHSLGSVRMSIIDVTADDSWVSAGESLVAADFGFTSLVHVFPSFAEGFTFVYDHANEVLLAYYDDLSESTDGPQIAVPDDAAGIDGVEVRLVGLGYA